jgi:phage/plasmid-like protein (TIGR03299 family)
MEGEVAHKLLIEGGQAAMFYVNDKPWHGLGTQLHAPPTSDQAIRAARLDWAVAKVPLYVVGGTRLHEVKDRFALVREDRIGLPECQVFGIAGRDYVPLQNTEAFGFFDPIVERGEAMYETAGALGRGERVWVLARMRDDVQAADGDTARRYLLLSNSHNGTSSVQIKFTPVRVVCDNTLTVALGEGGIVPIRHDRRLAQGLDRAKSLLGIIQDRYADLEKLFRRMVAAKTTEDAVKQYLAKVFPDPADTDDATGKKRTDQSRRCALHLFRHGKGHDNKAVAGSVWAAYNGVTEFIDHVKASNRGPDLSSRRLHSVWFGRGAAVKSRALRLAREWVEPV